MNKDQSRVQWTLPRWAADLIRETIELDSRSGAFDYALRQELSEALGEIDVSSQEIPDAQKRTNEIHHHSPAVVAIRHRSNHPAKNVGEGATLKGYADEHHRSEIQSLRTR